MRKKYADRAIRWLALLLILIGSIGLVTAMLFWKEKAFPKTEEEEVITFALYGDLQMQKTAEEVAEVFRKQNHCRVDVYCYSSAYEEQRQVIGQLASGKAFDVFYTTPNELWEISAEGAVTSLEDVVEERKQEGETFYPSVLETGKINGCQYGLPAGVMPYMIYYNQTLLEEAGLESPQQIFQAKRWDLNGFADALRKISQRLNRPALYVCSSWQMVEPLMRAGGGTCTETESGLETDTSLLESLQIYQQLAKEGVLVSCSEKEYEVYRQEFASGQQPLIISNLEMTRLCSTASFQWDILPYPSVNSNFTNSNFETPLLAVSRGNHEKLAQAFVSYYVSSLGQKLRLEKGECLFPSLSMVFYTSMGDVKFPEHSNYYFFAIDQGYACQRESVSDSLEEGMLELWEVNLEALE